MKGAITKRAKALRPGDYVHHAEVWYEVMDVEDSGHIVTCVTHIGGRVSFLSGDMVRAVNCPS